MRARMRRWWPRLAMGRAWAGGLALVWSVAGAQDTSLEFAVKATYLYKFAPFVQWPDDAFASPSAPLVLCVLGADRVTALVDEAAAGQTANGRPIVVQHLSRTAKDVGCHILYVAAAQRSALSLALASVRGTPVLTVADEAPRTIRGLVVNFTVSDNRVRFEIDLRAAADNGLAVSSKLLALALAVRQPHEP